ncbi:MAG: hypothetical protein IPJ65_25225 [Archangiaceae bacterium]|nr:hypothetical protein [Archangiaceae bacterium]
MLLLVCACREAEPQGEPIRLAAPQPVVDPAELAARRELLARMSESCGHEFGRVPEEGLALDEAQPCTLSERPVFLFYAPSSREKSHDLYVSMKAMCEQWVSDLEPRASEELLRTYAVGVLHRRRLDGVLEGDAFFYPISTGKLECGAHVDVKGVEGANALQQVDALNRAVVEQLQTASMYRLEAPARPVEKPAAKKPAAREKKVSAAKPKRKRR